MPENKVCLPDELMVATMSKVIDLSIPSMIGEKKKVYISTKEAMEMMNVKSTQTMQDYRNNGVIDYYPLSPKNIIYKRREIEDFIESKKQRRFI